MYKKDTGFVEKKNKLHTLFFLSQFLTQKKNSSKRLCVRAPSNKGLDEVCSACAKSNLLRGEAVVLPRGDMTCDLENNAR